MESGHVNLMVRDEGSVSLAAVPMHLTAMVDVILGAGHACFTPALGLLIARMGGHPAHNLPLKPERQKVNAMPPVPR